MFKYHHIGIPTKTKMPREKYLPRLKMYVSGYEDSVHRIEWMRFEPECPLPEIVKNVPHVAFEVDNLLEAIEGKKVIIKPNNILYSPRSIAPAKSSSVLSSHWWADPSLSFPGSQLSG